MLQTLNPYIASMFSLPGVLPVAVLGVIFNAIDVLVTFLAAWDRTGKRLVRILAIFIVHHTGTKHDIIAKHLI